MPSRVHETATVEDGAVVGDGTQIWQYAHVRERARVGERCVIGRGVYVGPGVTIGTHCKIENYALVYEPAVLEDGAFLGPAVVLTNDTHPRAVNEDLSLKTRGDWSAVGVTVRRGASIGAHAVCVAPVTIGAWALVAAGAVVVDDVPDFALVAGVPAQRIGWVGRAGLRLVETAENEWKCPKTGARFVASGPESITEVTS